MDNLKEQLYIRAEIESLNLISKHLKNLSKSSDLKKEDLFDLAMIDAELEAEEKIERDSKFSEQNDLLNNSSETLEWFSLNLSLDYDTFLSRLEKIDSLKEKISLTNNEKIFSDFYSGLAEFHLKNKKSK
ncbi:MAG: hypothetical protein GYB35_16535 [Algicola sp.]|nr:hypothetical protein [Algicola sp.]